MAVNEFARCPRRKTKEDQKHEDKEIFATEPLSVGGNRWCQRQLASSRQIQERAGPEHGAFEAYVTADIDRWIIYNELEYVLCRVHSGGKD